ncbi:MAG TPA: head GIN domain-containing protein [Mycobacterium sp.]|nr:head GIN domain-containing protein [Mycobacterium sp.]
MLAGAALLAAGCTTDRSTVTTSTVTVTRDPAGPSPSAPAITETREFAAGPFTAVRLAAHYDVVVSVGGPTSVVAQGDPAALDLLDIRTEGDTLLASVKPNVQWPPNARVTLTVTTPTLTAAELDGSGDMRIGPLRTDTLSIDKDGSGDVEAPDLTLTRLEVSSSGSGEIRAGGTAEDADITLDGSGDAELRALTVKRAEVSASGSGSLAIEATERVSGSISGSGDVEVTGGAACSISSTGSGDATCA